MATEKQKSIDITKTGPVGFRALQQANELTGGIEGVSDSFLDKLKKIESESPSISQGLVGIQPDEDVMSPLAESNVGWGESRFDNPTATEEQFRNLGDFRAEQQSGLSKITNGLAKGVILTGTTFLDGTVGLVLGAGTAIKEGRWSGLWDNDFSKTMQAVNEWSEEVLPNYYTQGEQERSKESPISAENIFSANFIGDKFLKNLGFTVGAFYSGSVAAKALQATKIPNLVGKAAMSGASKAFSAASEAGNTTKLAQAINAVGRAVDAPAMVTSTVGTVISAVNEGRIEALNNTKDWYNLEKAKLDDYFQENAKAIDDEYTATQGKELIPVNLPDGNVQYIDPAYSKYQAAKQKLQSNYEESLAKLNEDRAKMGNADLLMNLPILIASNAIEFGKMYANGYKTARKGVNIVNKGKYAGKDLSTAWAEAQATGVSAEEFAKEFAQFGAKEAKKGFAGGVERFGKNLMSTSIPEGLEEISQKAASTIAGDYFSADIHNFYKAKIDPEATMETVNWAKAFAQGINETINDGSSWEEFFIGALTGALGMPVFGRANTNSEDTYLGKGKAVGLRGGIFGQKLADRAEAERANKIADYINSRIQSPEIKNYYQGLTRHNKFQKGMNDAAVEGDELKFKDNEFAQMVSDIMMFDNAGKIGDLLTLVNSAYDTSTENLAAIVKNTTAIETNASGEKTLVGPFAKFATIDEEGKVAANFGDQSQIDEMTQKLTQTKEEMLKTISDYQLNKDEIDILTGQRLNDDQLQELTWIKMQSKDWLNRGKTLAAESREVLGQILKQQSESAEIAGFFKRNEGAHSRGTKKLVDGVEVIDYGPSEVYQKLSEKEKQHVNNVQALDSYLGQDNEGLFMALGSEKNAETVEGLKALAKELTTVSPADIESFNRSLDDMRKLSDGIKSYNTKMAEFLAHPEKQAEEIQAAHTATEKKQSDIQKNAVARRINFDAPAAEVAKALEENSKDITAMGGFDELMKVLTPEQRKKAKAAKRFSQGLNSIKDDINSSDLSDEQKRVANALLDREAANSKDIDEVGVKMAEALNRGDVSDLISQGVPQDGVNDLELVTRIADTEAKLKDLFDNSVKKAADAISALEKSDSEKLKKAADAIEKEEQKKSGGEPEGTDKKTGKKKTIKEMVPEEKGDGKDLKVPKEPKTPGSPGTPGATRRGGNQQQGPATDEDTYEPEAGDATYPSSKKEVKEKHAKEIASPRASTSTTGFNTRPQLSELYLHGRNGMTYLDYITEHPEAIPQGVDKEAYLKYVAETINYLTRKGAFNYVNGIDPNNRLKVGDTIEFKMDEELNKAAGTQVVLMVTKNANGEEQVIGSLPTALDFAAKNRTSGKTEAETRPAQKALVDEVIKRNANPEKGKVTTYLEQTNFEKYWADSTQDFDKLIYDVERVQDGRKVSTGSRALKLFDAVAVAIDLGLITTTKEALYANPEKTRVYQDVLIDAVQQLRGLGVNSISEFLSYLQNLAEQEKQNATAQAPITTKVNALRGGRIEFSDNLERSIAATFEGTPDAPVIAVLSESGLTTGDDELDSKLIVPPASSTANTWSIFAMVPANNGMYLPALCYSANIVDIIDNPDDWYMNQTIEAIKRIPRSIADLKENIKKVYKWLNIPGLTINIGRKGDNNSFIKETEDVSRATHVRMSFSNPKNPSGRPIFVDFDITNGELNDEQIRTKLSNTIKKNLPDLTTNVDIKRLTNTPANQEYRRNIAKYLFSNIMNPHSVNDFFTYDSTDIERDVDKKQREEARKDKKDQPKVEGKGRQVTVTLNGTDYLVSGADVTDADSNPVDEDTRKQVLASLNKPNEEAKVPMEEPKPQDKIFTALNMGGTPEVKIGKREMRSNRWSKKLAVTDTMDEAGTEEQLYQNTEKVRQMLPQLSEAGRIVIVNGLIKTVDNAGNPIDAYGEFRDGVLYISSQSPAGTAYHEAFHYVTDMLMGEQERATMLSVAKEQFGEMSDIALEERLAESFRDYMNGYDDKSLIGRIKTFFRNLKHVIKGLTGRLTYLDNLFYDIYKGRYKNRPEDTTVVDTFQEDLVKYKEGQLAYDKLDAQTKESLEAKQISSKDYENLTVEDKESILFCLV